MKPYSIFSYLLFLCLSFTGASATADRLPVFKQVWIAEAPPVSRVLAAYMTIENNSDTALTITSASAEGFSGAAFHKTVFENGMAKMQHLSELTIAPHSKLELAPGGFHMMLFDPARTLHAGDSVKLVFSLENGHTIDIEAKVKQAR